MKIVAMASHKVCPNNLLNYLLLFLLLFSACHHKENNANKMIFKYNEASGIQSLDPAFASGQAAIWACNQIFNGLVDMDDSLLIVPCIAKSWEILDSGKTYLFHLRQDVYFQQTPFYHFEKKRKLIAQDFVYSFNRILSSDVASPGAWIFRNIAHDKNGNYAIIDLNDSTLQIKLKNAFPPFLSILSMKYCSVLPKEVVEHFGKDFRKYPVGTGPFQIQLWKEGVKLVLRKNPLYFEKDEIGNSLPYLDAVSISFITERQTAFMEFMKGNIDFISGIEASYKDILLSKNGELNPKYAKQIELLKSPYLNTEYLGFNLKKTHSNPLLNKKIRQAINYGFSREKMLQYLRNNIGKAGTGFVPQGMPHYNCEAIQGYDYQPAKAARLLEEAGFPNGKGLPPISLSVSASYLDLCQYIQHELSLLGITITLDVQQAAQQRQMMRNYQLPFFRGSWIADYPDPENYLSLFYSKNLQPSGSNYTHYINADYDRLFELSQITTDETLLNSIYLRLDSILMADAPIVILFYDQAVRFVRKEVTNLGINPVNMLVLKKVKVNK